MPTRNFCLFAIAASFFAASVGCGPTAATVDPAAVAVYRSTLLLGEEPAGAMTPLDLREAEEKPGEVVLVGQIGGVANPWKESEPNFPWKAGEATFFLVDPGTAASFADHAGDDPDHAENCPFCARAAKDNAESIAVVTFADDAGKPIAIGASDLLGVEPNATVVVRGVPRLAGGLLIVEANGVYIRK